jgi:hypothetical protein
MNKRTVILCASVGTLVLSAAHVPLPLDPSGTSAPPLAHTSSPSSPEQAAEHASRTAVLKRLSTAYAPTGRRSSAGGASGPARFSGHAPKKTRSPQTARSPQTTGPLQTASPSRTTGPARTSPAGTPGPSETAPAPLAPPLEVEAPTLWLARAIYSETKLPHEQELVAWVIRNRVETGYRGKSTYRDVVLDPYQFSAFNPGSSKRSFLMRLGPETPLPRWRQALWVARYVRHAAPVYRPFSIETRHFYSERSMEGRAVPYWADRAGIVPPDRRRYTVEEQRFRFFKQIS